MGEGPIKAVFDTKPTSIYDDEVSEHYQFPKRYFAIVERAVGDWVVLRRPRADAGNLAYFALAKVTAIDTAPDGSGLSYARLSDFMKFDTPVPWRIDGRYAEELLRKLPVREVGIYLRGRSVRELSDRDFQDIIAVGQQNAGAPLPPGGAANVAATEPVLPDARQLQTKSAIMTRIVRDTKFRVDVYEAYDHTCAVTGLRILDAAGNSEVHAAHICGVARGGPDVVQNGIALSGTMHWLFDRYLFSISDDYRLLYDPLRIPAPIRDIFVQAGNRIRVPADASKRPHPKYLRKHRAAYDAKSKGGDAEGVEPALA